MHFQSFSIGFPCSLKDFNSTRLPHSKVSIRLDGDCTTVCQIPKNQQHINTGCQIKINQIFYYAGCIKSKRVMSWRGQFPRHCVQATHLFSKKCRSGGNCVRFDRFRNLKLLTSAAETNALSLDQFENSECYIPNCRTHL